MARLLVERWGVDAVEFYDNNFFVHQARTAEFAERIMDLGIAWWGEGRIDTLLKYSERSALDPYSVSGRVSMALFDELVATASILRQP